MTPPRPPSDSAWLRERLDAYRARTGVQAAPPAADPEGPEPGPRPPGRPPATLDLLARLPVGRRAEVRLHLVTPAQPTTERAFLRIQFYTRRDVPGQGRRWAALPDRGFAFRAGPELAALAEAVVRALDATG
jgi:hypothetical protein